MARSWPWRRRLEGIGLASRLSARLRLSEALTEARSSLEQYNGGSVPLQNRWHEAIQIRLVGRLAQRGRFVLSRERLLGRRARRRWPERPQGTLRLAVPSVSPSSSGIRMGVHAALLLLLLGALLLGGRFRGVLAQPAHTVQSGGVLVWQQLQPLEETEGVYGAYASIPALPVVLRRPPSPAVLGPIEDEVGPVEETARSEVMVYLVQSGDNLSLIASRFDLSIETLYWYNEMENADLLSVGQELEIPPMDGLIHEVEAGETLEAIAQEYDVRIGSLIAYAPNNLREPYTLQEGQEIFIPGAAKPIPRPVVTWRPATTTSSSWFRISAPPYANLPGGERFSWPVIGLITDRFGWTGTRWHRGLDIAAPRGTPIYSAAAGTVVYAGWQSSAGYYVELDHGEGWVTRYHHMMQQPEVTAGQWVERGQLLGFIGCTGWCTGPHVHFEVRYNGDPTNPLDYLQ